MGDFILKNIKKNAFLNYWLYVIHAPILIVDS